MLSAYKELAEFGIDNIFLIILLLLIFAVTVMETLKKLPALFNFETKAMIKERELNEKIKQMENDIKALQGSAKKFNEDRVHDRQQSFDYQHEYVDLINKVTETQKEIIKKVDDLAEQNRKYQLADIRETLLQAYRYYTSDATNPSRKWTEIEAGAFWEQYATYKDHGGNGYMESVVRVDMEKLVVLSLKDSTEISKLMESRNISKTNG